MNIDKIKNVLIGFVNLPAALTFAFTLLVVLELTGVIRCTPSEPTGIFVASVCFSPAAIFGLLLLLPFDVFGSQSYVTTLIVAVVCYGLIGVLVELFLELILKTKDSEAFKKRMFIARIILFLIPTIIALIIAALG